MKSNTVRDHYNQDVPARVGTAYEFDRWHKSPVAQAGYWMTHKSLSRILAKFSPGQCFELGPGAGTWTKLLCKKFEDMHIDAFDISAHMLSMAKEQVGDCNVSFIEGDFDTYEIKEDFYDLFFSSRVFEYLPNQLQATKKIKKLLCSGGIGIVTTKFPRGKTKNTLHQGRIHPKDFKQMLESSGMSVHGVYPLTLTVPFFKSATFNKLAFRVIGWMPFSWVHVLMCESYAIVFSKHDN